MRFLVAGLVLMALGIGSAEYSRRHREPSKAGSTAAKKPAGPVVPAAANTVLASEKATGLALPDAAPLQAALGETTVAATPAGKLGPALTAKWVVRELRAGPDFAGAAVDVGGLRGVLRLVPGQAPRVLGATKAPVSALCVDGQTTTWAADGVVWRAQGEQTTALVRFPNAVVTGLAHHGDVLLAALQPKDADPFAADANGAVVRVAADGTVTAVATEQVRPRDLLTDGQEAFWVGGYPAGLVRAALDGSFSARISERADGPLSFGGEGLVFRFPLQSGSELRRLGKAGGNGRTLATVDTDFAAAQGPRTQYTTSGMLPHLFERTGEDAAVDLLAIKGTVKALSASESTLVLAVMQEDGSTQVLWRSGPPAP